jgi:hypothetical protein
MSSYRMFSAVHPHGMADPRPHYHGFCSSCCHPMSKCCCGHRECRKVAKELLADPMEKAGTGRVIGNIDVGDLHLLRSMVYSSASPPEETAAGTTTTPSQPEGKIDVGTEKALSASASAVIGGGCCVHLSIEYMPARPFVVGTTPKPVTRVEVEVVDSEGTMLAWGKVGFDSYHIKEAIISTNPGARLLLSAVNAVARVRWCEVFSC